MELVHTVTGMCDTALALRHAGRRVVLVPTMGGLHAGHLALARSARQHGDHVIVSIFVNPTQFGEGEDYAHYPRNLEQDFAMLRDTGSVDTVFAPPVHELYPNGQNHQTVWVQSEKMSRHLCGPHRPGHFRGVLTVVTKLFNCCLPHAAVFGMKDAQQYYMIRALSEELCMSVDIIGHETVREPDGLALSSRNQYLSPSDRTECVVLFQSVTAARRAIEGGERTSSVIQQQMKHIIRQSGAARLEYAEVVSTRTLQPVETIEPGTEILAAVTVYFGPARLIDNTVVYAPH